MAYRVVHHVANVGMVVDVVEIHRVLVVLVERHGIRRGLFREIAQIVHAVSFGQCHHRALAVHQNGHEVLLNTLEVAFPFEDVAFLASADPVVAWAEADLA